MNDFYSLILMVGVLVIAGFLLGLAAIVLTQGFGKRDK